MVNRFITDEAKSLMSEQSLDQIAFAIMRSIEGSPWTGNKQTTYIRTLLVAIGMAIENKPFVIVDSDDGDIPIDLSDTDRTDETLIKMVEEKLQALTRAWEKGDVSNRSIHMLDVMCNDFLVDESSLGSPTIPQEIARSFHPDHRVDLPWEEFISWVKNGADDDEVDKGFTYLGSGQGYQMVRAGEGHWQTNYTAFGGSSDAKKALNAFARRLYERGIDIGAPDEQLREDLKAFV